VARNYRTASGFGEIDIIAWDGETLAFVEVKTRSSAEFGEPDRAVDTQKRELLRRAAREYLRRADVGPEKARFDVVSIVMSRPPRVEWFADAFGFDGD
jgi:putative endonuclease